MVNSGSAEADDDADSSIVKEKPTRRKRLGLSKSKKTAKFVNLLWEKSAGSEEGNDPWSRDLTHFIN